MQAQGIDELTPEGIVVKESVDVRTKNLAVVAQCPVPAADARISFRMDKNG